MAEAREGIVFNSYGGSSTGIDFTDVYGTRTAEVVGLSKSQIETMDLISEGPVNGPASGIYIRSGVLGEIGWRSVIFSGFKTLEGFSDTKWLRSNYWNEIPVLNDDGKYNFQSINVRHTIGKPNGEVIQVLSPFQTVSRSIGERLRAGSSNAKVYRILNKDCRGVVVNVKFNSLAYYVLSGPSAGDIQRTRVDYSISYKPIFENKPVEFYTAIKNEVVFGKIVSANGYIRTTKVDFLSNYLDDPAFMGWEIKIERSTPESIDSSLSNATVIDSITEIQGNIYTFPNSAMVRSLFDAEYFSSVPERAFDYELLKVKVPGNYDPILKSYSMTGFATTNSGWNGVFATGKKWTDNPAWCYYDLLTNKRYGLGKYIDAELVDTTSLYEIGKYCDTLVSDGYGGLEPRFSSNLWLVSKEEAYKVVNDMASIFRGMTYYSNGSIYAVQDSPKKPELVFTNANVENGNFTYSSSSRKARNSVAIVRYNDPKNFYKPAIEYVEDFESIRKYGIREIELTAFGCTSRGQAIRLGRWALLSDKLESESVSFIAGIGESAYLKPGDIFKVHDKNRKTKRYGGRTRSVTNIGGTGSKVILDYLIDTEPTVEYKISFLTPSYNYDPTQVSGLNSNDYSNVRRSFLQEFYFSGFQSQTSGSNTIIDLRSGFNYSDYHVTGGQVWMMELSDRYSNYSGNRYFANSEFDYYRTLNIVEKETNKFEIVALQYNPQKYSEIESGLLFQKSITNAPNIPESPYGLNLNVYNISANLKRISYEFLIDDVSNVDTYKVFMKTGSNFQGNEVPQNEYLIATLPSYTTNGNYSPTNTGNFFFRVFASNDKQGVYSPNYTSGMATVYSFESIQDVIISALQVENVTGAYSGSATNGYVTVLTDNDANPTFNWQVGSNNSYVITGGLKYRATVRGGVGNGLSRIPTSGIVYQETGITNTEFLYSLTKNLNSIGGPYRDYQVVVEAHDNQGKTSAGNQIGNNVENKWHTFPEGYDIISISNPRFSGAELKNNIPTQITGNGNFIAITGTHNNHAYIGPNGDVTMQFTSGQFDADLVGGYIYVSTGKFPKFEAAMNTGFGGIVITKNKFDFDPLQGIVYHPTAAINILNSTFAYVSLSFYDEIDDELIYNGINVSTGLYISNNAIVEKTISPATLSVAGVAPLLAVKVTGAATGLSDPIITGAVGKYATPIAYSVSSGELSISGSYPVTSIIYMGKPTKDIFNSGIYRERLPYVPNISSATIYLDQAINDSLFISVNNFAVKDDGDLYNAAATEFDLLSYAPNLQNGDYVRLAGKNNALESWGISRWTGVVHFSDGKVQTVVGGSNTSDVDDIAVPSYHDMGYFTVSYLD